MLQLNVFISGLDTGICIDTQLAAGSREGLQELQKIILRIYFMY